MRIAFVVNNYPPRSGGVEFHVAALARHLTGRGHEVTVVTLAERPSVTTEDGIHVIRLRERLRIGDVLGFPPPGTARRLRQMFRARGIELVSVHTRFFPLTWLGVDAARATGIPVILTEHGSDHVSSDSRLISSAARGVDQTLGRRALKRADQVLAVSEDVAAFTRRLAGTPAEVFYNAIPTPTTPTPTIAHPGRLVFVGRLVPGKGWDAFIRAVGELRRRGHAVDGTVLGGGPDEPAARALAAATGGTEVRGRVTPAEVSSALEGATLVNPTTLSEGFQTTLLEALAAGGRVVTYPVPGARPLADDGAPVTITPTPSEEALVRTLETSLPEPWTPYPQERLARWGWDARVDQFEAIASRMRLRG